MRLLRVMVAASAVASSGCWDHIEDHCAGCAIVEHDRPVAPVAPAGTHTVVVLVHGAFGFGDEWDPVVPALRAIPGLSFFAFRWPGPWSAAPREAVALARTLASVIATAPPSVTEVMVLAHSAGGMIANYAARQVRVRPGLHVTVALLDPALDDVSPPIVEREVNTTLGVAVGQRRVPPRPVPVRMTMTVYVAKAPPSPDAARPTDAPDLPRVYVGDVGHGPMVGKVVLPLLAARRAAIGAPAGGAVGPTTR